MTIVRLSKFRTWAPTFARPRGDNVLTLPVLPRLMPIPKKQDVPPLDDDERIDLLMKQAQLVPGLGNKIQLLFQALELEVGEARANRIVMGLISDYIDEKAA